MSVEDAMQDGEVIYCVGSDFSEDVPGTPLDSFDAVIRFLREATAKAENEYADSRAAQADPEVELWPVGGFSDLLRNRWGSEVEIATGRRAWFMFRHKPGPRNLVSDNPPIHGSLVYYLGGGHYTELGASDLVSRDAAIEVLKRWLETDEFSARAAR